MKNYLLTGQETERLEFRRLETSDFDAWLPFHQNPLTSKYWIGLPSDPQAACKQWFDRVFYRYENNLGGMNVLIEKKTGKLIGQCGLLIQTVDGIEELEIGYSILPQYWKKGFATEAATKCKTYAIENRLAKSVISIIHIDNIASQKVAGNIGMQVSKTTIYNKNPVDIYSIEL
jgi:RimJ/RimL family protein N-acetyltransferase